jgi:hypothetical protein
VKITVSNAAPIANGGSYAVLENTTLNAPAGSLQINDYDPDGDAITSSLVSGPSDGTVVVNANGSFVYTPNTGFVGSDSFTYEESDGSLTSSAATVNLTVKSSDTAPVANNDSFTLAHDTSLTASVQGDATDSDGDPLLFEQVSGPSDGTLSLNADGSFAYTPNAGYVGADGFQYEAYDGTTLSNVATVSLTIANDAPTANSDSYSVLPSGTTSVDAADGVLANDTDGEGDPLTAVLVSGPTNGNLTLNSDGSFSYTPGANFAGSDSFTYEAYDGVNYSTAATVGLTTAPVAGNDSYGAIADQSVSVDAADGVLSNVSFASGGTLTASLVTGGGPSHGSLTLNSDGSFTYTPATGFVGTDSFEFTASGGGQTSNVATATIMVTDSAPNAVPDYYNTPENTPLVLNAASGVLSNDSDPQGNPLTAVLVSGPANGTLTLQSNGALVYTPNTGWFGTDSFTYEATDGLMASAPTTVQIEVNEEVPFPAPQSEPVAVALGDFNGDGNLDAAFADEGRNVVSILLGNGTGALTAGQVPDVPVGTAPVALAEGNFVSGSSTADLAVVNSGSNSVSILLGNGDGTFTTGQTLATGSDPVALVVGDFTGNGIDDLAVVNEGSNAVTIYLGNGDGTFAAGQTLTVGSAPDGIAGGDFNGDGKEDLVVSDGGANTLSILLGNGDGTFASSSTVAVGTAPDGVAVADFNGDGQADIAVANSGSNTVSVLLGNGDGTFVAPVNYAVGTDPVAVAVGDFYGDGIPDLAVTNNGSNTVSELENEGNGVFQLAQTVSAVSHPAGIATGDLNKDGYTDEVVALEDPDGEVILGHQDPKTSFTATYMSAEAVLETRYLAALDPSTGLIKVWNLKNEQTVTILKGWKGATSIALDPRNPDLLAVGSQGFVTIVNVATIKNESILPFLDRKPTASAVAWSPDGKYLVAGSSLAVGDDFGMLWSVNGTGIATKPVVFSGAKNASVIPVKEIVVTGGFTDDGRVDITMSTSGPEVFTYDPKNGLEFWDGRTGRVASPFAWSPGVPPPPLLAFAGYAKPTVTMIYRVDGSRLRIVDTDDITLKKAENPIAYMFAKNGKLLLRIGPQGVVNFNIQWPNDNRGFKVTMGKEYPVSDLKVLANETASQIVSATTIGNTQLFLSLMAAGKGKPQQNQIWWYDPTTMNPEWSAPLR